MNNNEPNEQIPAGLNPSVCDPAERAETEKAFGRLYDIVKTLRAPGGCPWDREQTPETMRTDLVEEAFEAVDAINEKQPAHVCEGINFQNVQGLNRHFSKKTTDG